jgi:hypothetical protein
MGARTAVATGFPLFSCRGCGRALSKKPGPGRRPHVCDDCRQRGRARQSSRPCARCGATIERRPSSRGPLPLTCARCRRSQQQVALARACDRCGALVPRQHPRGPIASLCATCGARPKRVSDCADCGTSIEERGTRGPIAARCPECKQRHRRMLRRQRDRRCRDAALPRNVTRTEGGSA